MKEVMLPVSSCRLFLFFHRMLEEDDKELNSRLCLLQKTMGDKHTLNACQSGNEIKVKFQRSCLFLTIKRMIQRQCNVNFSEKYKFMIPKLYL